MVLIYKIRGEVYGKHKGRGSNYYATTIFFFNERYPMEATNGISNNIAELSIGHSKLLNLYNLLRLEQFPLIQHRPDNSV